jgi:phage-related baseplate assembly protein
VNYPGYRAAGILVIVQAPQVLIENVEMTVTVLEGYVDQDVKDAVAEAVMGYINSLGISDDVLLSQLITKAQEVTGVYNVVLTTPSADVVLLDDQLARTTENNVVVN